MVGIPWAERPLVAVGAPRHRHVGSVELLYGAGGGWQRLQRLDGEQVGVSMGSLWGLQGVFMGWGVPMESLWGLQGVSMG